MNIFDDKSIIDQSIEHNIVECGNMVSGISLIVDSTEILLTEMQLREAIKQISDTK